MDLADTSAWIVRGRLDTASRVAFETELIEGAVSTCPMVVGELLYTARNAREFAATRLRLEALAWRPIDEGQWQRALDVWHLLAERGGAHHRQVKLADLLIAAAAEAGGDAVLHYDRDYDVIAEVTGQPVRAVAPLGSL